MMITGTPEEQAAVRKRITNRLKRAQAHIQKNLYSEVSQVPPLQFFFRQRRL